MKILVCISVVPDTTTKVTFTENNSKFNTSGVQFIINPYDELSLTRALELTEEKGGEVTVIHVGLPDAEASIRKALAIGANDAVRIDANPSDGLYVAEQIAAYAKDKGFDLILTGRESIDYNGGMVGGLIAGILDLPYVNIATKIEVDGTEVNAVHDIDGGKETVKVSLPAVISAQKELTEPRIPNMRGIMAARTKPLTVASPAEKASLAGFVRFELPQAKGSCKMIPAENAAELIQLLHTEAKVI
jgi:electron transfer flavoprotein beta subunit